MEIAAWTDPDYAHIFTRPRETIRSVVDRDPRDRVIALIVISGFLGALGAAIQMRSPQAFKIGAHAIASIPPGTLWKIRLGQLIASPVLAVAFLYIDGALLRWSGRLLGGVAEPVEVRAALGWSAIPSIAITVLLIVLGLVYPPPAMSADPHAALAALAHEWPRLLLTAALGLYAFIVSLNCIAEVHRFSLWRGFGAWAIEKLLLAGAFVVLAVAVPLLAIFIFQ